MALLLETIRTAALQLAVFTLIPFTWWLITARKKENFLHYIGFKKPVIENKRIFTLTMIVFVMIYIALLIFDTHIDSPASATARFYDLGVSALPSGIIYAMITTGLAEEILFRGFITKRLIKAAGFHLGNIVQALLFSLLHIVLLFAADNTVGLRELALLFVIPFVLGWLKVYINEKQAGGSIIPGWILHGAGNLAVATAAMFGMQL